jgi:alpha-beta hydrolase superfamily lysophospholipase
MTNSGDAKMLLRTDGTRVHYRRWLPDGEVRGTVQIVHGASERSGRYGRLAEALTSRGLAVYAMDLRGHGRTAESTGIGRFGGQGTDVGVDDLVDDVHALQLLIADDHPGVTPVRGTTRWTRSARSTSRSSRRAPATTGSRGTLPRSTRTSPTRSAGTTCR